MKNILITGITGFVGSNFTQSWGENYNLYGLDIVQSSIGGVKRMFKWDELNRLPEVDAILHLAGKAHDTKNQGEAEAYFEINTELTKKVFDYFLLSNATTFIFFSSVKAAADSVVGNVLAEDVTPHPIGPYGESKIKAEEYILSKSDISKSKNKNIYILRPCMIYGPGNKGNLNLLYNVVRKGIPWPLGAYENYRSFCSIDNITFVVEQLIVRKDIESGIYHICDDELISTNELVGIISKSLGKRTNIIRIPKAIINLIAVLGSVLRLPLNKERLTKLTENYRVSNEKIKKILKIDKMPVSTYEGLLKTMKSFNENLHS